MEKFLTIDNGNSNPHVGVYRGSRLTKLIPLNEFIVNPEEKYSCLISDVGKYHSTLQKLNERALDLSRLRVDKKFLEMNINYSETLGCDRLFQAYYVFKNFLKINDKVLLIDSGTFTTLDVISSIGFEGGYIFPGPKSFMESFIKGANLPRPSLEQQKKVGKTELPHDTDSAVLNAFQLYIEAPLKQIVSDQNINKFVITGGSASFYVNVLKKYFSNYSIIKFKELIHESMAYIYLNHIKENVQ